MLFAARLERLTHDGRYCDPTLCTDPSPTLGGFVCRGKQIGDEDWSLACRRGREGVYSYSGN